MSRILALCCLLPLAVASGSELPPSRLLSVKAQGSRGLLRKVIAQDHETEHVVAGMRTHRAEQGLRLSLGSLRQRSPDAADEEVAASLWLGSPARRFRVLVDTGSGNLIVPSAQCNSAACQVHQQYNPHHSKSVFRHDNAGSISSSQERKLERFGLDTVVSGAVTLAFGSGSVEGVVFSDTVCTAREQSGDGCHTMNFLAATEESEVFNSMSVDGILGLAPSDAAMSSDFAFVSKLPSQLFALDLRHGKLQMGGFQVPQGAASLAWLPIQQGSSFWQVPTFKGLGLAGGKALDCSDCTAVLDSGTNVIALPDALLQQLPERFRPSAGSSVPCATEGDDSWPALTLLLGGTTVELRPQDYLASSSSSCELRIVSLGQAGQQAAANDGDGNRAILGVPFFKSAFSVFDAQQERVGIAQFGPGQSVKGDLHLQTCSGNSCN